MKRMLKSKEGISPILATLLLIVIAVAAVIVTYAWVMTFTTTQTTTAGKMIKYDSANINATSDVLRVYVRNTGTEVVTIEKLYIEGVDYTDSVSGLPQTLATSGSTATTTLTLNSGFNFFSGSTYKIKVTGPGVFWEESVRAT